MDEVKVVFQVFKMYHLKINYEKTKAILTVAGTLSSKVPQHFIRKNAQERRLLLSPGDQTTWLPLVRQAEYLGLIVSYGSFELQSLRHRVGKANNRRWALAAILHSRKIGIGHKLQIWRSCVLSTLTYGLHCCGLTGDHTLEAQRTMMRHARAIVSNQAHLTGDTHEYIMHKYNIQTVAELLRAARLCLFQEAAAPAEGADIWECPICEASFVSSAALKTHARRAHDVHEHPQPIFNKAVHSQGGLPVCKGCGKKFSKWQSLALHINGNSCTAITSQEPENNEGFMHMANLSTTATTQHICQMSEVSQASRVGINAFIPLKHVLPQLLQTCALCGQWCSSHRTLKRHYQYTHADLLQQLGDRIKTLVVKTATASSTCLYCQAKCKDWRGHLIKCTVAWQCAVMVLVAQDVRGERCPERVLRRSQAGVEPQTPATDGAASTDKAYVRIPAAAASRRISDFFSKTSVKAGGGATGAKAGPLANPVHEGGDRLGAQSSLLHGYPLPEEAGGDSNVGRTVSTSAHGACIGLVQGARIPDGTGMGRQGEAQRGAIDGVVGCQPPLEIPQWNPTLRCLQEDKERKPLPNEEMRQLLEQLYASLKGPVVTRFHCTRKLTETMDSQATFYLDLSSRGSGQQAWDLMMKLQGSCVLQLIGVAYKKAALRRGPLAEKIRELVWRR